MVIFPWWWMLSGGNSIWTRVDLASGEVGECWRRALGLGCQWDDQTRRLDGSLAVRSSGGEPSQSQWRWRRNLMGMEEKRRLLSGEDKNKNYFFIIWNVKMYLIRNFASRTKMKSHDMNRNGLLDCYLTAIAAWWKNNFFFIIWNVL